MSGDTPRRGFAARPGNAESWIRTPEGPAGSSLSRAAAPSAYTARITLDVTPATRTRLKLAALQRGTSVAEMLRALIDREFPDKTGDGDD